MGRVPLIFYFLNSQFNGGREIHIFLYIVKSLLIKFFSHQKREKRVCRLCFVMHAKYQGNLILESVGSMRSNSRIKK